VDQAQGGVALADRRDDDPEREHVEDILDVDPLPLELLPDRVEVLDPPRDGGLDAVLREQRLEFLPDPGDPAVGRPGALLDLPGERFRLLGVKVLEAEVLELVLDAADAEPVGDRRVDVEGLPGDCDLPLALEKPQGAHVVEPVRELDQDHPRVVGRGQQQAAEVLGLGRLVTRERALEGRDLVRAATSRVTSGPNSSSSSAAEVSVSSRMSWSMPTAIAVSSSSISARIQATVSGGQGRTPRPPDLAQVPLGREHVGVAEQVLVILREVALHPVEDSSMRILPANSIY